MKWAGPAQQNKRSGLNWNGGNSISQTQIWEEIEVTANVLIIQKEHLFTSVSLLSAMFGLFEGLEKGLLL